MANTSAYLAIIGIMLGLNRGIQVVEFTLAQSLNLTIGINSVKILILNIRAGMKNTLMKL